MEPKQNDRFLERFGWIRCLRCFVSISQNSPMVVLTCRHHFCTTCFRKGCQILNVQQRVAVCAECRKRAKYAPFNENLPSKFLEGFQTIDTSTIMRAAHLKEDNWKWKLAMMSKNVAKKRYIVKEKRAQLEQLRASNAQLKQQHDERYRSMLKHFSVEQLNHLLSYSMDELKAMPVDVSSPTGESFEPSSSTLSSPSSTSLYRRVLVKNASSNSSSTSLLNSPFSSFF